MEILEIWIAVDVIVEASDERFLGGCILLWRWRWNGFWIPLPGIDVDVTFIAWQKSKASELYVFK